MRERLKAAWKSGWILLGFLVVLGGTMWLGPKVFGPRSQEFFVVGPLGLLILLIAAGFLYALIKEPGPTIQRYNTALKARSLGAVASLLLLAALLAAAGVFGSGLVQTAGLVLVGVGILIVALVVVFAMQGRSQ